MNLLALLAAFVFVVLASKQIGALFAKIHLPLISGFIFAGIVAGPFVLGLIPRGATDDLRVIDQISLAVIAFNVGSKLYLDELRDRFRSIGWISAGMTLFVPLLGFATVLLLADHIPFLRDLPWSARIAIAILIGAVLGNTAPAPAIAIINEMRARGPFTQTVLGVTMVVDIAVIVITTITLSSASAVLNEQPLNATFAVVLVMKFVLTGVVGILAGVALRWMLAQRFSSTVKIVLMLTIGLAVYVFAYELRARTAAVLPYSIQLDPLLACLLASFYITNRTQYRTEFLKLLNDVSPTIYLIFFTLVGAGLPLDVLAALWPIALALFAARVLGLFLGGFGGGVMAGDPMRFNRVGWMTILPQAGVGLGLAKSISVENAGWGAGAAAMIVSTIVINELIGPPLFRWALNYVGESHAPAPAPAHEGQRSALIFGLEGQSVALARMLVETGWKVRIGAQGGYTQVGAVPLPIDVCAFDTIQEESLRALGADAADTIITWLSDEENLAICELAFERFGTEHLIVRLNHHRNHTRFEKFGAVALEPSTSFVSLLAHYVRAPAATSLLLGAYPEQDVVDLQVRNPALDGLPLRDVRLPLDVLVLSVARDGDALVSHGYTRLRHGDVVTVLGSSESLEQVALHFSD